KCGGPAGIDTAGDLARRSRTARAVAHTDFDVVPAVAESTHAEVSNAAKRIGTRNDCCFRTVLGAQTIGRRGGSGDVVVAALQVDDTIDLDLNAVVDVFREGEDAIRIEELAGVNPSLVRSPRRLGGRLAKSRLQLHDRAWIGGRNIERIVLDATF